MRVALVHDWLVTQRGGEKVLEALGELFPEAEIFTLLHRPGSVSPAIEAHPIHTSFLQRVPGIDRRYRHFLPLMPAAIRRLDLTGFDLVISSSHCVAKGVRIPPGARHLSYVHAPMRYMWDLFDDYFGPGRASLPVRVAARLVRPALRSWDKGSARSVQRFVANSHNVAEKIRRLYGRQASVLPPPVELERFGQAPLVPMRDRQYFLWVGAFAPYKRLDLALEAFAQLPLPLWVVGSGQDAARLQGKTANVRFLEQVPDAQLPDLYARAHALIFPGEEDFGLTPLEAQACGTPVIAYGKGGALETVTEKTGIFFHEQSALALVQAVRRFQQGQTGFDPQAARTHAASFSKPRFLEGMRRELELLQEGRGA